MYVDPYHTTPVSDYTIIGIFALVSAALALVICLSSFLLIRHYDADPEKVSAYECGFDPFDDSRSRFDVRFYLVSILFIVFDLEVSFLFPWSVYLSDQTYFSLVSMVLFLAILTVGFVYEWKKDALDWE
jgi:NADH:ubiquinone oxidoreductase subunit 3 (subunit A)